MTHQYTVVPNGPTLKFPYLLLLIVFSASLKSSTSFPEGPPRFRLRDRFPVHFKSHQPGSEKSIDDNSSTKLSQIQDVTNLKELKIKPTVRIFEIGTGPIVSTSSIVGSNNRFSLSSTKSLLDDTDALGIEHTSIGYSMTDEYDADVSDVHEPDSQGQSSPGQETFFKGIFSTKTPPSSPSSFLRSQSYSFSDLRPTVALFTLSSTSSRPGLTVTVPVPTRPPIGPLIGSTEIPLLGIGVSPSISSILPPAPPSSSASRSLFGRSGSSSGNSRKPISKGVASTRFVGNNPSVDSSDGDVITDFVFSEIKCYRTKQKEYFGAKIHMKTGYHVPYIRDRPQDPLTSSECQMEETRDQNTFHMKMTDLRGCGVEQCGDSMCVTMVFPRVPTLALADDEVTTIKCLPQKNSMAEMKTISFAGDSLESRRSGSTVEGGGQEFAAEVGVFRQNPGTSNGLFVKRVNSGGVVQLGEPLQLRSVVRGGDGWTFSKLTDIKVWRMRDTYAPNVESVNPGDASEVITLVDGRGCRNGEYRVIAETDPLRDPRNDLVHHFTFKAFLFRGQRANEPLIVTAKVQACQERDDCGFTDCAVSRDSDGDRYKRSLLDDESSHLTKNITSMNWNSHVALRVVGLKDHPSSITENDFGEASNLIRVSPSHACAEKMGLSAAIGAFLTLLFTTLGFTLISFCRRGKRIDTNFQKAASFIDKFEHSNGQLRRTSSAHVPNSDYVRQPIQTEMKHPLQVGKASPPIPMLNSSTTQKSSQVAKLLQQLSDGGDEYKSIDKKEEEDDDGVYVLYYKRSKSAPSSLRGKSGNKGSCTLTDVETCDSEDDGVSYFQNLDRPRRTVRSVKKRSHRREKTRERKSIPNVYREQWESKGGRGANRNGLGGSRTSIHVNHDESESSSDMQVMSDSAYSTSSTTSKSLRPCPTSNLNKTTHFVTRNESSTQIIIIPETNV